MPMPSWWGHINKRVFNPRELRRGKRPVLTQVGRRSGEVHHTPLDAHPVHGGFLFILVYGDRSDWVRNVLATDAATLCVDGEEHALVNPRVLDEDDAWAALPPDVKRPPGWLNVKHLLRMDLAPG